MNIINEKRSKIMLRCFWRLKRQTNPIQSVQKNYYTHVFTLPMRNVCVGSGPESVSQKNCTLRFFFCTQLTLGVRNVSNFYWAQRRLFRVWSLRLLISPITFFVLE